MCLVPNHVRTLLIEVAEWMTELKLEKALMEVVSVPNRLVLNPLHHVTLDYLGVNFEVRRGVLQCRYTLPRLLHLLVFIGRLSLGYGALKTLHPDLPLDRRTGQEDELTIHDLD